MRIELEQPVDTLDGEVEVTVRALGAAPTTVADVLGLVATFPHGGRSKQGIDRQVAEERAGWDRRCATP